MIRLEKVALSAHRERSTLGSVRANRLCTFYVHRKVLAKTWNVESSALTAAVCFSFANLIKEKVSEHLLH